jgi:micrococcal nuclease
VEPAYRYRAVCQRVIDGDTYDLAIDLGFKVMVQLPVRLYGWNCPEHNAPGGAEATAAATKILMGQPLIIESYKSRQTFARWLATVWVNGKDLGELLQGGGHAVPYHVS